MRFDLSDERTVRAVLSRHGFSFSKALGQNFLIDPTVCPEMARAATREGADCVLEIGPGIGVLTASLCEQAKKVIAVELDRRLFPVLRETLADYDNVELVEGDAMQLDLHALLRERFGEGARIAVCANLPYYITSPLLMRLLECRLPIEKLVVMVQKEAAERLCAEVGSREAGAVTVAVRYYAEAHTRFTVGREAFLPAPKVDSAVIELCVRKSPAVELRDEAYFFKMVRAAFAQRRKTAVNGIAAGLNLPKAAVAEAIADTGLPADVRAEKIPMEKLADLANRLLDVRG
ncbi:MAG TPA: 16S rRNA (adenine(1518)-N(6)/adenine(1519)-N(6))-dimethyltransferase RsmA [Candidatus Fimenecus stercoravium]|nr:16S rRNA (adenine(1518)-N(6)/adenine(1519)-N(6))-dimethyltransferase RsmA [Candidatus Fimenecus stercoravium]